ncbi:hypothetical protein PHMEG_00030620 [Phytophthora megakarya]|uniref:Uncharacterized protein n=1 Tax=Phytophthora megakarya TaxID=4795 RepID=A0A225UZW7_9STRA|nr:hypothetical protein PHMEG_00030620 [Phytophthora megakarya]
MIASELSGPFGLIALRRAVRRVLGGRSAPAAVAGDRSNGERGPDCTITQRSESSLAFLIGDNCATNRAAATRLQIPLNGCASHRFNLAVNAFLEVHKETVDAISTVMLALRTINNRAALRPHINLARLRPNVTC